MTIDDEGSEDLSIYLEAQRSFRNLLIEQLYLLVLSDRSDGKELFHKIGPKLVDTMASCNRDVIDMDPSQRLRMQKQRDMGKIMAQQFVDSVTDQLNDISTRTY